MMAHLSSTTTLLVLLVLGCSLSSNSLQSSRTVAAFSPVVVSRSSRICRHRHGNTNNVFSLEGTNNSEQEVEEEVTKTPEQEERELLLRRKQKAFNKLPADEKMWRYANKPLLRIGGKGATKSHGNSLRQLLEDHTIVKVKVNVKPFATDGDDDRKALETAAATLTELAVDQGAPADLQVLQLRTSPEKVILFGLPGTLDRVQEGSFPPPLSS